MQKVFHSSKLPRPDLCSNCSAPPKNNLPFRRCGACKTASYCSVECQRQDWKVHKPLCITARTLAERTKYLDELARDKSPSLHALPTQAERLTLLNGFLASFTFLLQRASFSALMVEGGVDKFDYTSQYLRFDLRSREGHDGNPSMAFSMEGYKFCSLTDMPDLDHRTSYDQMGPFREKSVERGRQEFGDSFAGLLTLLYIVDESFGMWAVHLHSSAGSRLRKCDHHRWFQELQKGVLTGMVYRKLSVDDHMWRAGRLEKQGQKWVWKRLEVRDLVSAGIQRGEAKAMVEEGMSY